MPTSKELKHDFLNELAQNFGPSFLELINPPEEVQVGERVLYKIRGNEVAERKEMSPAEFEKFRFQMEEIAGQTEGSTSVETATSSGYTQARTVDLPESDVAMQIPAEKFLNSDDLLPTPNHSLEWMLGIIYWSDYSELLYIDFTHPQVKATFCSDFGDLYDKTIGGDMFARFEHFLEKRAELILRTQNNPHLEWAKIAQIGDRLLTHIKG